MKILFTSKEAKEILAAAAGRRGTGVAEPTAESVRVIHRAAGIEHEVQGDMVFEVDLNQPESRKAKTGVRTGDNG